MTLKLTSHKLYSKTGTISLEYAGQYAQRPNRRK